jgi:hypothetical protein
MATSRKLLSLLGKQTRSATFQTVLAADKLKASKEPDLEEGQPAETYFVGKKAGYEILAEDGRVVSVFLYVEAEDGYWAFSSPLPFELKRGATRTEVRRLLGKPQHSGKAEVDDLLGPQGPWDRFSVDEISVHIEYSNPGLLISKLTLMPLDVAP